jgi:hypothetical protein
MRILFTFMCMLALGLMGCGETAGTGGSGGTAGEGGMGGGGTGGSGGIGGDGGTGGMPECENAEDCDDQNECTDDVCNPSSNSCENAPVQDGSPCGGETYWGNPRGGCYGGSCNFVPVSVAVGEKEVVFDWSEDNCEDLDIPDGPAGAVRAEDGEIVLFATHYTGNFLSRGGDFDTLVRVCDPPPLVSAERPTPDSYENFEWLWSPYRVGANWHVLIHNEYHPLGPFPCTASKNCWHNSITYAVSTDNAATFEKPGAPAHVVAPAPEVWTPPGPDAPVQTYYAEGYFAPSGIVLGPDDHYYTGFHAMPHYDVDYRGMCIMRTKTLHDPASWRAWDGSGFNLELSSPYVTGTPTEVCGFVQAPDGPAMEFSSLTYNTYLDRYMAVGIWGEWVGGKLVCGVYLSLSFDLIHWSHIQLMTKALSWCETDPTIPGLIETVSIGYPSIIDHTDPSTNFERPGRTPYLYYSRFNDGGLDRDLVRVPVRFTLEE